jgi:hypothetical protein
MTERSGSNDSEPTRDEVSTDLVSLASQVAAGVAGAGIAMDGSTVSLLLGAAAVPVIQTAAASLVDRRSRSFDSRLRKHGVSPEGLLQRVMTDPGSFDLFRRSVSAALATSHEGKRKLLADILVSGILAKGEADSAYARRLIDTVSRIDALEILVLRSLEEAIEAGSSGKALRADIATRGNLTSVDMVDAALAVLQSEGLVMQSAGRDEQLWRISGYGRRLIGELREVDTEST